ncbi:HAD family hydrolase [Paenibacillus crassostreae]|uniref:HAD family hydrolase n=1 Tax=Paenibacillus crassostreae TaxID=1763538 RepID=UPI000AD58B1A|nr:HAD family hydrolase [Paenibacillus crassostreae]
MGQVNSTIGVFFDVDDTLYDHLDPLRFALQHVLLLAEEFPYESAYHRVRYYSDLLTEQNRNVNAVDGVAILEEMRSKRYILALEEFGISLTKEQAVEVQSQYLARQFKIKPYDGAIVLLKQLQVQGVTVGLITNGPLEHQMRKIKSLCLDDVILDNHIFVSGGVGLDKPDPRLFAYVNEMTETTAEHSYYIGDTWRNDVVGAMNAGWNMLWFNPRNAQPESNHTPHYIVKNYEEISRILLK